MQREDKSDGLSGSSGGAGCTEGSRVVGPDVILLAAQDLTYPGGRLSLVTQFCHLRGRQTLVGEGRRSQRIDSPPAPLVGSSGPVSRSCSKSFAELSRGSSAWRRGSQLAAPRAVRLRRPTDGGSAGGLALPTAEEVVGPARRAPRRPAAAACSSKRGARERAWAAVPGSRWFSGLRGAPFGAAPWRGPGCRRSRPGGFGWAPEGPGSAEPWPARCGTSDGRRNRVGSRTRKKALLPRTFGGKIRARSWALPGTRSRTEGLVRSRALVEPRARHEPHVGAAPGTQLFSSGPGSPRWTRPRRLAQRCLPARWRQSPRARRRSAPRRRHRTEP